MVQKSAYAHRKAGRKPPRLKRQVVIALELLACFVVVVVVGYAIYQYTVQSDRFQVKNIQIEGLRALNEDEIIDVSGLFDTGNVLYLNPVAVKTSVEALPFVKHCEVKQVFPDSVVITIEERVPYLTVQLNSRSYMIDEDRVVLRQYRGDEVPLTPFITNVGGLEFAEPGDVLNQEGLIAALRVWELFKGLPMSEALTVSEVTARSRDEIFMYCDEMVVEIRWGQGSLEEQAKRLSIFWDHQDGALPCNEYLDLRFGDDLICK